MQVQKCKFWDCESYKLNNENMKSTLEKQLGDKIVPYSEQ